jgi:hypothetical protein
MLIKICTWPSFAAPSLKLWSVSDKASEGKDGKNQDTPPMAGTQPPHIAGPLAQIFQYVMIMLSRRINNV